MKKYIWALDISMSMTGVSIFSDDGRIEHICSIGTNAGDTYQLKLKYIGKELLKLRKTYPPKKIIIEAGFTRFNRSTQVLFRCHGLINYLFWDIEQIYYPATTIKKGITGKGNVDKTEVQNEILRRYPKLKFQNTDESDSFSIGLFYFMEKGIIKAKCRGKHLEKILLQMNSLVK